MLGGAQLPCKNVSFFLLLIFLSKGNIFLQPKILGSDRSTFPLFGFEHIPPRDTDEMMEINNGLFTLLNH